MKYVMKSLLVAAAWGLVAAPAMAEEQQTTQAAPAAQASQASAPSKLSNVKASLDVLLVGPTYQDPDGRHNGKGPDLLMRVFPSVGYKISPKWTLRTAIEARRFIRPKDETDPNRRDFLLLDPYVTASNGSLLASEKYGTSLAGSIRYYVPTSGSTANGKDSRTDKGNGMFRVGLIPSVALLDSKMTVSMTNYIYYRLQKGNNPNHNNYDLLFVPSVAYTVSPKVEVSVEYGSGYIRHTRNVGFTKLNATDGLGQWISPGLTYTPNKFVSINPYLSWGRAKSDLGGDAYDGPNFKLNQFDIAVNTSFTFL